MDKTSHLQKLTSPSTEVSPSHTWKETKIHKKTITDIASQFLQQ